MFNEDEAFCAGFNFALALLQEKQQRVAQSWKGAIKPNDRIVSTNATVLMDEYGELSWLDNNNPMRTL